MHYYNRKKGGQVEERLKFKRIDYMYIVEKTVESEKIKTMSG